MAGPVFILATELEPGSASWEIAEGQAASLAAFLTRLLGFAASVKMAVLPAQPTEHGHQLAEVVEREIARGARELFVLPMVFELNIWQRTLLGQALSEARRVHQGVSIHHDDVNPSHPLLVDCFVDQILRALDAQGMAPRQAGVLLVASGQGDPGTRAASYHLMRLLWEQTGLGLGEVGFVRHEQPFLLASLERCRREALDWILLSQCQWHGEIFDHAQLILGDYQRTNPEARRWQLLDPVGDHPAILGWLEHRARHLWQDKRARQAARMPSQIHQDAPPAAEVWAGARWVPPEKADLQPRAGFLARARSPGSLAEILSRVSSSC